MDPAGIIARRKKWGRFLPHQRANVDQVPLPFVNNMEIGENTFSLCTSRLSQRQKEYKPN